MKKYFFTTIALLISVTMVFAQEDPGKALSKAGRALGSYNLDPLNNGDKLKEAIDLIEIAANGQETQKEFKMWQTRGEIYNALADKDLSMMSLDQNHVPENANAPVKAAESFMKALELASKKYEIRDASKGLKDAGNKLNAFGNSQINRSEYNVAYKTLGLVLTVNEVLKSNGEEPLIKQEDINNHKFVVAYCAITAGDKTKAKELFKELYDAGDDEPTVYAQYFNLLMSEGDAGALTILETGRKKFPDNTEILFAEINYYISQQRYDVLEAKLKEAIDREPDNPSVYSALGNVYMNLYTKEYEKNKESETAKKYFANSLDYFNQALNLDKNQFDAIYSIGSLYFNKAVELIKSAADLGMTAAEQKKYKELEKESSELMNTALPYFQRTEALNPNDENTLIALSEIFARMNDFEKSKEFKDRLQVVRDGGKNENSYFKQ